MQGFWVVQSPIFRYNEKNYFTKEEGFMKPIVKQIITHVLVLTCICLALCTPAGETVHASITKSDIPEKKVSLDTPVITQLMPLSKTSFSIKWDLVDDADGYIICQKVNGKWKRIKTIAAYATNHYTVQNLTYNKKYTFAIRAYRVLKNGTKQLSNRSKAVTEKLSYSSKYVDGYLLYYDASGDLITNVDGIIGAQKNYTVEVNRTTNTTTVYAYDSKKKAYIIPVKTFLCSTGTATPAGTFKTSTKYRWHALYHDVYGQWCTRITGHILFHSVYYGTTGNANTLDVAEFNKLGTAASAGCIRLTCADVKWLYDNCGKKTTVIIYDSDDPGPLGYEDQLILDDNHTWDPTDPNMKSMCTKNGCHME